LWKLFFAESSIADCGLTDDECFLPIKCGPGLEYQTKLRETEGLANENLLGLTYRKVRFWEQPNPPVFAQKGRFKSIGAILQLEHISVSFMDILQALQGDHNEQILRR